MPRVFTLDGPARERLVRTLTDALTQRSDVSFAYLFGSILERHAIHDMAPLLRRATREAFAP